MKDGVEGAGPCFCDVMPVEMGGQPGRIVPGKVAVGVRADPDIAINERGLPRRLSPGGNDAWDS